MMKIFKITLISGMFISTWVNGQATRYHPFPDSNAVWNFEFQMFCFYNDAGLYSFTLQGDTLINNRLYHQLHVPFVKYHDPYVPGFCGYDAGYKGAIRQDTALRKVFIVPPDEEVEDLLYDFTLSQGDSLSGYITRFCKAVVATVDSVLVGSDYRKRWNFYSIALDTWFPVIEGIGSGYGLTESLVCHSDPIRITLQCFSKDNQVLYSTSSQLCDLITGISKLEESSVDFIAHPNPADKWLDIELLEISGAEIKLDIFSVAGQRLMSENLTSSHERINVDHLPQGIYIAILSNRFGVMNKKQFVISR